MAKADAVFIYIGTYPSEAAARADYKVVKDLHAVGAVGTYDASVVTKDNAARCTSTRMRWPPGTARGAAPPSARSSASCSRCDHRQRRRRRGRRRVSGHLWRGMSRADVKELGEIIDDGQAALLIVGESKVAEAVEKAGLKAEKQVAKELDVKSKDIDKAVREAASEVS